MTRVVVALVRRDLGLGHLGEVDRGARSGRGAVELLADVGADPGAELVELVRLLDAVVQQGEPGEAAVDDQSPPPPAFARALNARRGPGWPLCTLGRLRGRNGELSRRGRASSVAARLMSLR